MLKFSAHSPRFVIGLLIASTALACLAQQPTATQPIEIHDRISPNNNIADQRVALTLDACSGHFDEDLILFLIRNRIPATIFATEKWLLQNPQG